MKSFFTLTLISIFPTAALAQSPRATLSATPYLDSATNALGPGSFTIEVDTLKPVPVGESFLTLSLHLPHSPRHQPIRLQPPHPILI